MPAAPIVPEVQTPPIEIRPTPPPRSRRSSASGSTVTTPSHNETATSATPRASRVPCTPPRLRPRRQLIYTSSDSSEEDNPYDSTYVPTSRMGHM